MPLDCSAFTGGAVYGLPELQGTNLTELGEPGS